MEKILTGSGNLTSRNMARFKVLFPINFVAFIVMAILGLQTDFSVWVRLMFVAGCLISIGIGVWVSKPVMQDTGSDKT